MIGLQPSPFLSGQEINDLKSRTLTIDCRLMELSKQGAVVYRGAGLIGQDQDGQLAFTLCDPNTVVGFELFESMSVPPGTWQKLTDLYLLKAVDLHDREWTASVPNIGTNGRSGEPGTIVRGPLRQITASTSGESHGAWVQLLFPGQPEIHTNAVTTKSVTADGQTAEGWERNLWIFQTHFGKLVLGREAGHLELNLTSDTASIPGHLHERLEEVAIAVLAAPLASVLIQRASGTDTTVIIRSELTSRPRARQGAPIWPRSLEATEDAADLFSRLLKRIVEDGNPAERHPLTLAVRRSLHAGSMSLDAEALTTATQVESVVNAYYAALAVPSPAETAIIGDIVTAVTQLDIPAPFAERTRSLLIGMKAPRTVVALRKLVAMGKLLPEHLKAWESVRHRAAHGTLDIKDVPATAGQCDAIFMLLWSLVFDQIGYKGRWTDYCAVGWPLRASVAVSGDLASAVNKTRQEASGTSGTLLQT